MIKILLLILGIVTGTLVLTAGVDVIKQIHVAQKDASSNKQSMKDIMVQIMGRCSGVRVKQNNKYFILTAGHCRDLITDNRTLIIGSTGVVKLVDFLVESPEQDLMLLTGDEGPYANISSTFPKEKDEVYKLGYGKDIFVTKKSGKVSEVGVYIPIPLYPVSTLEDYYKCKKLPYKHLAFMLDEASSPFCFLSVWHLKASVDLVPGDSGGGLFNTKDELVGITSARNDDNEGLFVPLKVVREFLKENAL